MQRIFLIGYMGAGKTTVGKKLSAQMGLSFIDLDCFIERRHYKTIRQIFEEKGEAYFREMEQKALREVAEFEDIVIATGGGTPCFHDNMAFMNAVGVTVYLKVPVDELVNHLKLNLLPRPVLRNRTGEELRLFVEKTLSERSPYYEQASLTFLIEFMHTEAEIFDLSARLKEQLVNL